MQSLESIIMIVPLRPWKEKFHSQALVVQDQIMGSEAAFPPVEAHLDVPELGPVEVECGVVTFGVRPELWMFPMVFAVENRTRFLVQLFANLKNTESRKLGLGEWFEFSPFDPSATHSKAA